jgi:hypothetical protein
VDEFCWHMDNFFEYNICLKFRFLKEHRTESNDFGEYYRQIYRELFRNMVYPENFIITIEA